MLHWFIWKGKNSLSDYGLWISKLPNRTRPEERHDEIEIPGRAGNVVMLEGEDVYNAYPDEMTVIARNSLHIDRIIDWLRGSGELVLSTDTEKYRQARIVNKVSFERASNDLMVATIPFVFQPFRRSRNPVQNDRVSVSGSTGSIFNPGDIASNPVVSITGSGNNTITIAGNAMSFSNLSGTVVVDCDAQMITSGGDIWTESVTGNFWKIPKGASNISQTGSATIVIDPNWGWL